MPSSVNNIIQINISIKILENNLDRTENNKPALVY